MLTIRGKRASGAERASLRETVTHYEQAPLGAQESTNDEQLQAMSTKFEVFSQPSRVTGEVILLPRSLVA